MADRLTLTRAFEDRGINREAAERIATKIFDSIRGNVATKADLRELEQRFELRFEQLERRIDRVVVWLGALVVVVVGLLFAALQRWPPH
jgi:hypothetical protein